MLTKLLAKIVAYNTDENGATAIEYGLIAAGIAVVISVAVYALGGQLSTLFDSIKTKLAG